MLAGEARNIASVRADFLGSHPGIRSPAEDEKDQQTLAFGPDTPDAAGLRLESSAASGVRNPASIQYNIGNHMPMTPREDRKLASRWRKCA